MNILVCVKPVPDVSIVLLAPDMSQIDSGDLVYVVNPPDMIAVEAAVQIKERVGNSQITLVSIAPPQTKRLLHHCLAVGADNAVLVWDKELSNVDGFITATILSRAVALSQYDLILCGDTAADTEAGQVGGMLAEMVGIPLVSKVVNIEVSPRHDRVIVDGKLEGGKRQIVEVILPALLSVDASLTEPRYSSLPSLIAALRKDIKEYDVRAIGISPAEVGSRGSRTTVTTLSTPKPRPKKLFTPDSTLSAEERMRLVISGGVTKKKENLFEDSPEGLSMKFIEFLRQANIL